MPTQLTRMKTKQLTLMAMLSAIAFLATMFGRIPIVLFLKYDPSDAILTIGGFLLGPLAAAAMSVTVSVVEMLTISDTGIIGAVMNIISTCAFACMAAFIYKRKRSLKGAVIGLVAGWLFMTAVMLLWNYCIAPIYMKMPRADVAALLLPAFLPFNLLKGGLNAALSMLLYKPLSNALHKSNILPSVQAATEQKSRIRLGGILVSLFVIATCVLCILILQGRM